MCGGSDVLGRYCHLMRSLLLCGWYNRGLSFLLVGILVAGRPRFGVQEVFAEELLAIHELDKVGRDLGILGLVEEGLDAVVILNDIEQLACLLLPGQGWCQQLIAQSFLIGRHPLRECDAMSGDLAEVALPLSTWALFLGLVTKALSMKSCWTVIAANQFALFFANATLIGIAI